MPHTWPPHSVAPIMMLLATWSSGSGGSPAAAPLVVTRAPWRVQRAAGHGGADQLAGTLQVIQQRRQFGSCGLPFRRRVLDNELAERRPAVWHFPSPLAGKGL
jgi:hypothetical protein